MAFPVFAPGDVLNASDMNAVGLWLVKTQTIGTTVSSVTVTDAFSANYRSYRIIVTGGAASTAGVFRMTLGATTANYYYGRFGWTYAGTSSESNGANVAFWECGLINPAGLTLDTTIHAPHLADETTYISHANSVTTTGAAYWWGGFLNNQTSYTAFTLTANTGTLTGGEIAVYGFNL